MKTSLGSETPNRELELKFEFDSSFANRLRNASWLRALQRGRASTRALNATYYDTPDKDLHGYGLSLRVRKEGREYKQTLKSASKHAFARDEYESRISRPMPDRELIFNNPEYRRYFGEGCAERFEAVFETRIKRTTRNLIAQTGSEIACDLDVGEITTSDKSRPIMELELELKSGDPRELFEIARKLNDTIPVRLVKRSKAEQGYALLNDAAPTWHKAPDLVLPEGATGEDVLVRSLIRCLDHLGMNEDCVLTRAHPEGVHQVRVALRRMRAGFGLYKNLLPVETRKSLSAAFKWAAGSFGPARDWDVFGMEVLAPVEAAAGNDRYLAQLRGEVERQQEIAYSKASAVLASPEFTAMKIDLVDFLYARPWRQNFAGKALEYMAGDARVLAAHDLSKAHHKLLNQGKRIGDMSKADRHQLRLDVKNVRYAAEFFAPLYRRKSVGRYLDALKAVQDDLGVQNDLEVARHLVNSLTDANDEEAARRLRYAGGVVVGWHTHAAEARERTVMSNWKTFTKAKPFWN